MQNDDFKSSLSLITKIINSIKFLLSSAQTQNKPLSYLEDFPLTKSTTFKLLYCENETNNNEIYKLKMLSRYALVQLNSFSNLINEHFTNLELDSASNKIYQLWFNLLSSTIITFLRTIKYEKLPNDVYYKIHF